MQKTVIALTVLFLACGSRPPAAPPADEPRLAVEILYVGVPSMNIYAEPTNVAPVITTYGYTETVSILARKGDWVEVRTVDGSGWAHAAELIGSDEVQKVLGSSVPRFATVPVTIPNPRARGEIVLEAKVNTDGQVIAVRAVKNTTGSKALLEANTAALRQATFYPIVLKGQRMTFTYEYQVSY